MGTRSHSADKWQKGFEPIKPMEPMSKPLVSLVASFLGLGLAMSLFATSSPQSNAPKSHLEEQRAAHAVFRAYTRFEEKQEYAHIYDLLSRRFKLKLEREENVKDEVGYKNLRLSSEAQWSNFQIGKIEYQSNDTFKFIVTAKVEESGVVDNVKCTYSLVRDRGKWRIDRWDHPVGPGNGGD